MNFQGSKRARKSGDTGAKQFTHKEPSARTITGEACDCPEPTAPTTPGVVLDLFDRREEARVSPCDWCPFSACRACIWQGGQQPPPREEE